MLDKLNAIEAKYSQIEARLGAPETYNDPELVARLNKEQAELQPLVDAYRAYRRTLDARDQAEALMADPEMKELAQEEYQSALEELPRLEKQLQILLLPKDPNDGKNGGGGPVCTLLVPDVFHVCRVHAVAYCGGLRQ